MVLEPGSIVFCHSQAERRRDCTPQEGHPGRAGIRNFRQFLPLHRVEAVSKLLLCLSSSTASQGRKSVM